MVAAAAKPSAAMKSAVVAQPITVAGGAAQPAVVGVAARGVAAPLESGFDFLVFALGFMLLTLLGWKAMCRPKGRATRRARMSAMRSRVSD